MMLPAPKNRAKVMKPKLMISWVRRVEFIGNTQENKNEQQLKCCL